ncbi:MAG: XRE family transcriptional regulator [Selenomonadaceae bacterium]|nr:XRE family transcriptional regulator [Selenomonadaceae bacterium]
MRNFRDFLTEELKDPEFKKEWDALEDEFKMIREKLSQENFSSDDTEKITDEEIKYG